MEEMYGDGIKCTENESENEDDRILKEHRQFKMLEVKIRFKKSEIYLECAE